MSRTRIRARRLSHGATPEPITDPSILRAYLEDASGSAPGQAAGLLRPADTTEIAAFLAATSGRGVTVLPQAARSSLTAGAIPGGEVVISVEAMGEIGPLSESGRSAHVGVGPGVRLCDLQRELASRGWYYPPVPTYQQAMVAGTVATNAGGAASFKYGVTRDWVRGLSIVLFNGDVLEIERGECTAGRGEELCIELSDGRELRAVVPDYELPPLKKISAGYFSSDPLDLVDLFIGSEGTLGVIAAATLELVPLPAAEMTALAFVSSLDGAIALGSDLRAAALAAREHADGHSPDVRAIELLDGRALELLRRHGDDRRLRVNVPPRAGAALLFETEFGETLTNETALASLQRFLAGETDPGDGPLIRLFDIIERHGALDELELAFPEDHARAEALREFREAVPRRVNEILTERRRAAPGVSKVGGDLIVPFAQVGEILDCVEREFSALELEFAVWGHLSDGNLHPNALPRDAGETRRGLEALLRLGDEATRRGGCPLSEHGVGRNPIKQELMQRFHGTAAIASMRAIKSALDPEARFAPGVLFPADS